MEKKSNCIKTCTCVKLKEFNLKYEHRKSVTVTKLKVLFSINKVLYNCKQQKTVYREQTN